MPPLGAISLFLLCVPVPVAKAPIPSVHAPSSISIDSDGSDDKLRHSSLIRRDTEQRSSSVVDFTVDEAGKVAHDSDIDPQLKQHLAKKRHGTEFASEFAMRDTRSAAEETLLQGEAEANLLDELVYHEDEEDGLGALERNADRTAQGCLAGSEEFYGNRCYKKCSTFGFEATGTGNAGFDERVAPNSCRKDTCNTATEDNFGNNCYKICADLVASYPIRKAVNKCRSASGSVSESSSYNVGYGPGNAPRRIVDVAGDDCPDTVACCKGYNVNDDPSKPNQCPYIPTEMGSCVETLTGVRDSGYRGCQFKTRNGRTCQKWNSQSPHPHSNTPSAKPGLGLGNHNKCRNPDSDQTIWCYTTDPNMRWEYCDPL